MGIKSTTSIIEDIWREYLRAYAESRIKIELQTRWGSDPNVVRNIIQPDYPPTFQPGYIGTHFVESEKRILFIGYNPGQGKNELSQEEDKILSQKLNAFANGEMSLTQLSTFQGSHLIKWPIYNEKGIFLETGDTRIALLPKALRPSISSVALLNLFPFKTVDNKKPLAGSLKVHMWESFVRPTIEALSPAFIVRYPDSDQYLHQLGQLDSNPRIVRIWHPSNYNLSAQREKLEKSWMSLAAELSATH